MFDEIKKLLGVDQLKRTALGDQSADVKLVECVANTVLETVRPYRAVEPPMTDGIVMTALIASAGVIHGELMEIGVVPDMTDEAKMELLMGNFASGVEVGRDHVRQLRDRKVKDAAEAAEAERAAIVAKAANDLAAGKVTKQ